MRCQRQRKEIHNSQDIMTSKIYAKYTLLINCIVRFGNDYCISYSVPKSINMQSNQHFLPANWEVFFLLEK